VKIQPKIHPVNLKNVSPPGAEQTAAPRPEVDKTDAVELRFNESGPPTAGLSMWQKVLAGGMAGIAGFTALAPTANAAPIEQLVTQAISETDGLEVTVIPPGTARVDILRKTEHRYNAGRTAGDNERDIPYSDVGVHLGRGLFHDSNGNLSLIPTLAGGWEQDAISDFSRVELDIPGYDENVTRFGDTVHHKDGRYSRNVYVETTDGQMEVHRKGDVTKYEVLEDGIQFRGAEGLEWRITQDGNRLNVDGPDEDDYSLTYSPTGIDVVGQRVANTISTTPNRVEVTGSGADITVSRSGAGVVTQIEQSGPFNDYTIIRDGNTIRIDAPMSDQSVLVNPSEFMDTQSINYTELARMIEEAEPGYAEKHPLVMGLLEYATANPGLVGEDDAGNDVFLDVGKGLATGGGALQSGTALLKGAEALSLAENARALGASAAAAKAAAQAAAASGNLSQAAALGAEAQNLAGQAQALGSEAHRIGDSAMGTAKVARVMTGVAGALEIVDGAGDLHKGASSKDIVQGAIVVTEALRERLTEELTGSQNEQMMEDYSKVMQILNGLKQNANKQIRIGGMKIGCGGLMLISALAGGAVIPPIIGAVGMVCTVGTSVYENWDQLEAYFTGTEVQPDPTLRDVLPGSLKEADLFKID
jgi:hypothetical protein